MPRLRSTGTISVSAETHDRLVLAAPGHRTPISFAEQLIDDALVMSPADLAAFVERCRAGAVVAKSRSHRNDTNVELPPSLFDRVLDIAQAEAVAIGLPLRSANKSAVLEAAINTALDEAEQRQQKASAA